MTMMFHRSWPDSFLARLGQQDFYMSWTSFPVTTKSANTYCLTVYKTNSLQLIIHFNVPVALFGKMINYSRPNLWRSKGAVCSSASNYIQCHLVHSLAYELHILCFQETVQGVNGFLNMQHMQVQSIGLGRHIVQRQDRFFGPFISLAKFDGIEISLKTWTCSNDHLSWEIEATHGF